MTKRKNLLVLLMFASFSSFSFSQTNVHKTDVNKDIDVVRVYEQVVKEGYGTPFIYKELATAYYFKSEYAKALAWFQKFFSDEKNRDPELRQRYNQSLKAVALESSKNTERIVFLK